MKPLKLFISHKMSGLTDEEIKDIRWKAIEEATTLLDKKLGKDSYELEVIDNYNHNDAPKDSSRLWHLGRSIQQMPDADYVYFYQENGTKMANGCMVEMLICILYNIPMLND